MNPVPVLDMLAFVGFSLAFTATTRIPVSDDSPVSRMARGCLTTACAVYVFAMGSNVLEHAGVTSALDPIEDYIESECST